MTATNGRWRSAWDGFSRSGPHDFGGAGGRGPELNFTGSTYAAGLGGHVGRGTYVYRGTERRGPKGYERSDERINEDLFERLSSARDVDVEDVTVQVQNGVVRLDGTVPERAMKHRIEDLCVACPGVADVDNRLRVR